jgi:predicted secreted protein
MNTKKPQTMLFTHSWFASKEYKLNSTDNNSSHLSVSEASMSQATSEKFPLDMIEATPELVNKIDPQLLTFTLISALASGIFFTLSATTGLIILSLFGGLFLLATIASSIIASRNKMRSYTYFYMGSDTPMFTLTTKQADREKVEEFVKNLNHSIELSTRNSEKRNTVISSPKSANLPVKTEEQEYLAYTYHLDFLFASGLIDDESYLKVGHNISDRVFGNKQTSVKAVSETNNNSNIIHFPG